MPNIGAPELIVILIIALVIIGPGRLPDVGAALGKSIREFRKASTDMTEAARIDTTPLPPSAAPAPSPQPPTPVATAPTVPAPLAVPPDPAADETADRTS
jgi:sec-independent protein translocase protein TatA